MSVLYELKIVLCGCFVEEEYVVIYYNWIKFVLKAHEESNMIAHIIISLNYIYHLITYIVTDLVSVAISNC